MHPTSQIFAKLTKALPTAIGLTIIEFGLIWFHIALHLGMPQYLLTMPITWPANFLTEVVGKDRIPDVFLVVLIFFGLLFNTLIFLVIVRFAIERLRRRRSE